MARKSQFISISALLGLTVTLCVLPSPTMGQVVTAPAQQSSNGPSQIKPVSLEHLYWHFLVLQNFLDTKAATQESNGKDGSGLRNRLQRELKWSDADYAPIHTSSARLTAEVQDLDAQARAITAAGTSSSSHERLKALTVQREADLNAEVTYLKQNLSPDKIRGFETFLALFFSPKNAVPGSLSAAGQVAPAAVQK